MKCVIPGANVKVFGKAIHCLGKIGEDVWFEFLSEGLAVRTVNSSRSAYASFLFRHDEFFQTYSASGAGDDTARCKLSLKSCLPIFKSVSQIDRQVDKCRISLSDDLDRLVFQLSCRHGLTKTYQVVYSDCEPLKAVVDSQRCTNHLIANSKLLCDSVLNFQTAQEEVTMTVTGDKLTIKSYVDDANADPAKVVYTSVVLDSPEFDTYIVSQPTAITYCLRELRAILAFTDSSNMPVDVYFEGSGRPVVIVLSTEPAFLGEFVIATVSEDVDVAESTQQSASQPPRESQSLQRRQSNVPSVESTTPMASGRSGLKTTDDGSRRREASPSNSREQWSPVLDGPADIHLRDRSDQHQGKDTPAASAPGGANSSALLNALMDSDSEGEGPDVPGTPPAKKMRPGMNLFAGLLTSQSTCGGESQTIRVLAADTDDDSD